MKTTSGSLSLLSATNRWCFGDKHGGVTARSLHPTPCPQFPNPVVKAARASGTPEPRPHPRLLVIAGAVAHQGHPASIALNVLHRRGLAGWVLLATHLGVTASAGRASEVGPEGSRRRWSATPTPTPRQQWTVRTPLSTGGRRRIPGAASSPGAETSIRRGGGSGSPASPAAAAQ